VSFIRHQGIRSKVFPTCLPVSEVTRVLKESGLGKPLFKASSGQALDELSNHLSSVRRSFSAMGTDLPDPEAVSADEAFRRGRPDRQVATFR